MLIGPIVAPGGDIARGLVGGDKEGQQRPGRARRQRRRGTGDCYPDRRARLTDAIGAVDRGGHDGRVRPDVTAKVTGDVTRTSPARNFSPTGPGGTSHGCHRDVTVAGQRHTPAPEGRDPDHGDLFDGNLGAKEGPAVPASDTHSEQPW